MSLIIRLFQWEDSPAVIALWQACGLTRPWNNPQRDIQRKMDDSPNGFLVGESNGELVAVCMVGYEGHRGWVNYLAVAPSHQRQGFGQQMMRAAEEYLLAHNCPKLNLQIRTDNLQAQAFYHSLGYTQDAVISMGKRLIADE